MSASAGRGRSSGSLRQKVGLLGLPHAMVRELGRAFGRVWCGGGTGEMQHADGWRARLRSVAPRWIKTRPHARTREGSCMRTALCRAHRLLCALRVVATPRGQPRTTQKTERAPVNSRRRMSGATCRFFTEQVLSQVQLAAVVAANHRTAAPAQARPANTDTHKKTDVDRSFYGKRARARAH